MDCKNKFCYYYGEFELCFCRKCSRMKSIAFIQQCEANRRFIHRDRDDEIKQTIEEV